MTQVFPLTDLKHLFLKSTIPFEGEMSDLRKTESQGPGALAVFLHYRHTDTLPTVSRSATLQRDVMMRDQIPDCTLTPASTQPSPVAPLRNARGISNGDLPACTTPASTDTQGRDERVPVEEGPGTATGQRQQDRENRT